MPRLDLDRQEKLEHKRIDYAKKNIIELGYDITFESDKEIHFYFKGSLIKFFPYSGWHTGKTIKDGRGINKLLKQIKDA